MKTRTDSFVYPVLGDFHIHTCYSDGIDTIDTYCHRAEINGLAHIAFTEHVRKELSYDFNRYLSDIATARKHYPDLNILAGCEAKVIDRYGNLDVRDSVVDSCDFVTAVFHSFPYSDKETYLETLEAMLVNPVVDIWGHPTLFAKKHDLQLEVDEIADIIETCVRSSVSIEINQKYNLPNLGFLTIARKRGAKFVFGSDAHAVDELLNKDQLVKLWENILQLC